jgi:putative addiction module component (TIGR02574 family)
MTLFEEIQNRVLGLPPAERGRLAVAVLDSLEDEPVDEGVAEAWANEVLARSAAYSRGELKAVDWREALHEIETDLNEMSPP